MKKKLFLAILTVMIFTCLFAVSVNAAGSTENTYGDVTTIEGVDAPSVINASAKTVIVATDGTYYTIPTYCVLEDKTTAQWKLVDEIKTLTGVTKANDLRKYVVRMEIPEGIEALCTDMFKDSASLLSVKFPTTLTDIGVASFANCKKLVTAENLENTKITELKGQSTAGYNNATGCFANCDALTEINLPSTVTYIEQWAATSCYSLTKVTVPNDAKITYIGQYAFEKSLITEFYFSSELTYIGKGAFEKTKLTALENFENTQLTEVVEYAFNACPITEIKLPSTLTKIGQYAFGGHKAVQDKLVIPNGVTEIGKCAFAGNYTKINEIVLPANLTTLDIYAFEKNVVNVCYIPSTLTKIPEGLFKDWGRSSNILFVYTGTSEQLNALLESANTSNNGVFTTDAKKNIKSAEEYGEIVLANVSGKSIVYGYNPCKAFYSNVHNIVSEEGNTCSGTCDRVGCGLFAMLENPVHTEELKLVFGEDKSEVVDYYADMYVVHVCKYCAEETATADEYGAIFVKMGFSVAEDDTTSISFFTAVNLKSLEKYEEMAETDVQYGIVVSAAPSANPITGVVDGKPQLASSTINIAMQGTTYTTFSVKITGLPENQTLNCCGYAIEGEKVTYLNHATADAEATTVSHAIALQLQQASVDAQE
ncbi:MAG: leucine-rich repeat protein [Clostridia bacterium]|nr:leucine-rich repeat protein [Clostridia bacterium]